jgi:hypothetical protein
MIALIVYNVIMSIISIVALYFNFFPVFIVYATYSIVVGISGFIVVLSGNFDAFAKRTADVVYNNGKMTDFLDNFFWAITVFLPLVTQHYFIFVSWLILFLLQASQKDKINKYVENLKSKGIQPNDNL